METVVDVNKPDNQTRNALNAGLISDAERLITQDPVVDLDALGFTNRNESDFKIILDKSEVLLPKGKIYALVTERDTKKHTILEEIIGFGDPLKSRFRVSNHVPGAPDGIIPRRAIGYLPHKTIWMEDDLNREDLNFWGKVHGVPENLIEQRVRAFTEYLSLRQHDSLLHRFLPGHRNTVLVAMLREKLAAALIHSPSLLVLEPLTRMQTPAMKERIWTLLRTLTLERSVAILLLTDDPREAFRADTIGFFDRGRVTFQITPDEILRQSQCETVEQFIERADHGTAKMELAERGGISESPEKEIISINLEPPEKGSLIHEVPNKQTANSGEVPSSWDRALLLLKRRLRGDIRTHMYPLLLLPWLPILLVSSYFSDGNFMPTSVAVVVPDENSTLAQAFLDSSWKDKILQRPFRHIDDARAALKSGETLSMMRLGQKLSAAPHLRFRWPLETRVSHASNGTTLDVEVETDDQEMRFYLQNIIISFVKSTRGAHNASYAELSLEVNDPVYGRRSISYPEFLLPGIFMVSTFLQGLLWPIFSHRFLLNDHLLDMRYVMAGVKLSDAIVAHCLNVLTILFTQVALVTSIMLLCYWNDLLPLEGSLSLASFLVLAQGLQGVSLALMISSISMSFREKSPYVHEFIELFLGTLVLIPANLVISAGFWRLLPVPRILHSIARCLLPITCTESLRDILYRGKGLGDSEVLIGFTESLQRSGVFLLIPILVYNTALRKWGV